MSLWEYDHVECREIVDVPPWIDQDITCYDVASIIQGGCASGAYMPAVTYYQANKTMSEYGDDVTEYIDSAYGEIPQIKSSESWSSYNCTLLSWAVELWAMSVEEELLDALEDNDD